MVAIIDYGAGNLFSLKSSLTMLGEEALITDDPGAIKDADHLFLPGVGAFGDAIDELKRRGLDKVIKEEVAGGKPLMGICLGMQLLFEKSLEYGVHEGLGLVRGTVKPLRGYIPDELKVPQIGWNSLEFPDAGPGQNEDAGQNADAGQNEDAGQNADAGQNENPGQNASGKRVHPVFRDIKEGDYVYFVHSFYGDPDPDELIARVGYGMPVTAAVAEGSAVGCQFHPEKSGDVGLRILKAFLGL